jgi:hypothetical protein
MSFITAALIGAGGALAGGLIASSGARSAAGTQAASADRAAQLQKEMFDKQMAGQEPFRQAGLTGQNRLMELLGLGGNAGAAGYGRYSKDFSMSDFEQDPGYAFRLKEGMSALNNQAAARGGLISGNALRAAQKYGQDMASQEYGNAFNRYQTNRANQLQPLGSLLASGQSAAANQGSAAGQYGVNAGNAYMAAGNAIGAGQLGSANSLASGIQTGVSSYQNQTNFNDWLNRNKQQSAGPSWGSSNPSSVWQGTSDFMG